MKTKLLGLMCATLLTSAASAGNNCHVLVVVGMEDERAIAQWHANEDNVEVVVGSANAARLRERLSQIDTTGVSTIYSFGVAGGLNPALQPGELLIATQVLAQSADGDNHFVEESWMSDQNLLMAIQLRATKNNALDIRKGIFLGIFLQNLFRPD